MSNLLSALRGEIEAIVRREVRLALKSLSTAAAPAAGKRGPGRPAKSAPSAKSAGSSRVAVSAKDLQSLRGKLKVSGPELGRLAGVSTATIYNWEKAKGSVNLSADVAATVAKLHGMTADQAREQLGPAAKRGRKPGKGAAPAAKAKGKPGRKPGKAKSAGSSRVAVSAKDLQSLRGKLKVSGPELGRLAGVSTATIYNWEKAKGSVNLSADIAATVTKLLGTSAEQARAQLGPAAKRGRKPGQTVGAKKRGRPAKAKPAEAAAAAPKKRGRPAKAKPAEAPAAAAPKKRGRPAKVKPAEAPAAAAPKKRGRPAKAKPAEAPAAAPAPAAT